MDDQTMTEEKQRLVDVAVKAGAVYAEVVEMTEEDLKAKYDPPEEKKEPEKESGLMKMSLAHINEMTVKVLKGHCKDNGMLVEGKRDELLNRVLAIRFGRIKMYVGEETRCAVCGAKISVRNTASQVLGDGRTLVTRSVKCKSKHAHTYPLKNIV